MGGWPDAARQPEVRTKSLTEMFRHCHIRR
jgi:hypothetical protein